MAKNHTRTLCIAIALSCLIGCGAEDEKPHNSSAPFREPPDVGDVGNFNACLGTPRRVLSEFEQCKIRAYKERCTAEDDCFVTCISSPDSPKVGGGCGHVCGLPLHREGDPPPGLSDCRSMLIRAEG